MDKSDLAAALNKFTHDGWTHTYEHPGYDRWSKPGINTHVSHYLEEDEGVISIVIQVQPDDGRFLCGDTWALTPGFTADEVFEVVKPFLKDTQFSVGDRVKLEAPTGSEAGLALSKWSRSHEH